ncbi:hypothetical protein QRQ56_34850 [Bradyrhizobium sp. U531]|uniref:hypothetical protein n=1 Tax=Bradyrhizobium sp. U531 TaxID=3053458 RepID=UPI003F4343FD
MFRRPVQNQAAILSFLVLTAHDDLQRLVWYGRCSAFAWSQGAPGTKLTRFGRNSLPFEATGKVMMSDGVWKVDEFIWQMDAIVLWARFEGRWLRG